MVDVPRRPPLQLDGFRPNPSRGGALIAFTLPSASTGILDVYDVSGRRVFHSSLSGRPAGSHVEHVGGNRPLAPGVYVIRLRHSGREVSARGVVVE